MPKASQSMKKYKRLRRKNVEVVPTLRSGLQMLRQDLDLMELMTGAFIAVMCVVGNDAVPWLFAQARDTVLSSIAFEMLGMPILGLFADHAMLSVQRVPRIAWLAVGVVLSFICGALTAIMFLAPGLILAGVWLIKSRLQCPAKLVPYSREHCYVISCVALSAWLVLLLAMVLLMFLSSVAGTTATGESAAWSYALTWGGFYLTLAIALPIVRRRAARSPRLR